MNTNHLHRSGDVVVVRGRPYQLLTMMGRGGQGSVFEARAPDESLVAIKLVPSHERHRAEARIMASLRADHVVRLLDAGVNPNTNTLIMVMERVEGVDLKALIRLCREDGRLIPTRLVVELVMQACIGLIEATQHGQLAFHRDIKPGNLILSRNGIVKLIDFGIAHLQDMAYTGSLVGTPENMAPEQVGLEESWRVDIRTDLYCLGLVLYELLTLETLTQFPQKMLIPERLLTVWKAEFEPQLARIDALQAELGQVLRRCVRRNPAERFQTPTELLQALARVLPRLPSAEPITELADCVYAITHHDEGDVRLDLVLPIGPVNTGPGEEAEVVSVVPASSQTTMTPLPRQTALQAAWRQVATRWTRADSRFLAAGLLLCLAVGLMASLLWGPQLDSTSRPLTTDGPIAPLPLDSALRGIRTMPGGPSSARP